MTTCELIEAACAASIEARRSIWECLTEARRLEREFSEPVYWLKPGERIVINLGNMNKASYYVEQTG
jgi:hypothetical protein